jgi:hypothetical protein
MLSPFLSSRQLESLIAECKLLRILNPQLKSRIRQHQGHSPYLIQYDNEIYLSLQHIEEQKERQYYYRLIQRYQSDQAVDLRTLPGELQQILQPDIYPQPFFWAPLILGGVVGLVLGVLGMAVGMLFWNASTFTFGNSDPELINIQIPTLTFVFFSAFGWIITSFFAWRRLKKNAA